MTNLIKRSIFGSLFVVVTVGCMLNKYAFLCFAMLMMALMLLEFYALTIGENIKGRRYSSVLAGVLMFLLVYMHAAFNMPVRFLALAQVPVLLLMMSAVCLKDKSNLEPLAYLFAGLVYVALPVALSPMLVFHNGVFDGRLMLAFFIIIWCGDVGAYALGTAFGQKPTSKKLCPEISPKKSWIGVFGGYVTAVAGALILHACGMLPISPIHCIVLASLLNIGGIFGDLFESMWKRRKGVKDSGNIIPGHGGILDRFDSSLVAMPLGAIYLAVVGIL